MNIRMEIKINGKIFSVTEMNASNGIEFGGIKIWFRKVLTSISWEQIENFIKNKP